MKNLQLKLWSLLIAIAIAYFVNSQTNAGVVTLVVPIELKNLPAEKLILLPNVSQAKITVRGPSYLLGELNTSPPSFKVRVPDGVANRFEVTLQGSSLALPPKVEVLSIDPATIEYILDDKMVKEVPVVVPRVGEINSNYTIKSIKAQPGLIKLEGPKTELDGVKTVQTSPLDLRGLKESETRQLGLNLPGKFTKASESEVQVAIDLVSHFKTETINNLPVEIRSTLGKSFKTEPATVSVEVSGPEELVKHLKAAQLAPYVRVKNTRRANMLYRVSVDLPQDLSLIRVKPERVRLVDAEKEDTASKSDKK